MIALKYASIFNSGTHLFLPFLILFLASADALDSNATSKELAIKLNSNNSSLCFNDGKAAQKNLFDNTTEKCFREGDKGPCGKLMRFYSQSFKSDYGVCSCIRNEYYCMGRPIAYWKPTNRCYFTFDQGPCKQGEWIIETENGQISCQKNPCTISKAADEIEDDGNNGKISANVERDFYFLYDNVCYRTNTKAYCTQDDTRAYFTGDESKPRCHINGSLCPYRVTVPSSGQEPKASGQGGVATAAQIPCPQGTKRDENNNCAKIVTFDP